MNWRTPNAQVIYFFTLPPVLDDMDYFKIFCICLSIISHFCTTTTHTCPSQCHMLMWLEQCTCVDTAESKLARSACSSTSLGLIDGMSPICRLKVTVYAFQWWALFFVMLAEEKRSNIQLQLFVFISFVTDWFLGHTILPLLFIWCNLYMIQMAMCHTSISLNC